MSQQKPNSFVKQSIKQPISPTVFEDDDNRIDWERKNVKKKRDDSDPVEIENVLEAVDDTDELLTDAPLRQKKGKRSKRRHLVMDEESGQTFVKRRRKSNRWDEWLEEYD